VYVNCTHSHPKGSYLVTVFLKKIKHLGAKHFATWEQNVPSIVKSFLPPTLSQNHNTSVDLHKSGSVSVSHGIWDLLIYMLPLGYTNLIFLPNTGFPPPSITSYLQDFKIWMAKSLNTTSLPYLTH